ncbi:type I polyketide synthase [Streptomyces spiramyceticus]|uniref:type I polyketide synthase n=1 Tax=Streptomyces spiramyceticus TaxID=299717 RepID=UPI00237C0999|nr:beta-ketoacyl synthase N-terminal-like domain-containing protein [Streptomyces spiramyceticus]
MRETRTAVVGMALRFPGADSPRQYWEDIRSGTSHVRRFTDAEFAAAGIPEEAYRAPDFVGASAPLRDIDGFDAGFFRMSGREAAVTDPQQRLFLECAYHALEDGGYARPDPDVRIGVYASSGYRLYSLHSYLANNLDQEARSADWHAVKQVQVGNYPDFTATRAAFRLGLTGPAVNVATACSSSLVSVHLARQALASGDADLMVVGSAALHLPQVTGHLHVKGSTLSRTGTVRAFDAAADGTVGGNGVAAVLLKPLDRALADGDTVHAVILGSAVTNDGADKGGFAAPGVEGQRDAVLGALRAAGVPADTIGYLEAHGTGTLKGDPIEFAALSEAFARHTDRTGFCALGSTKPAIGHLDSCAGLAGLIKAILVLRHGEIPPLVNYSRPNPALDVAGSPFVLPDRLREWPAPGGGVPRRAGVHSIGMGGTNAHVILEEAPPMAAGLPPAVDRAATVPGLLPLSAHDGQALVEYARAFRDHLVRHPGTAPADLLTGAVLGRRHLRHRLVVTAEPDGLLSALDDYLDSPLEAGRDAPYVLGEVPEDAVPEAVFLFSGQGGGSPGTAATVAARFPVVAETLDACARIHRDETGEDTFLERLLTGTGPEQWDTEFAQPAIFALQVAQARLWRRLGVEPAVVAGHSVGEYAALCVAGALTLEDGMRLVCRRGRLMQRHTEPGGMIAVLASEERVRRLLADVDGVELAAVNGPAHHVVAGPRRAVAAARAWLTEHGEAGLALVVDRAFHTSLIDPVLDDLRIAAEKTELRPTRTALVSGLDGVLRPAGWLPDADDLVRQAREPVDFHAILRTLAPRRPLLVELGPDAPLTGMARRVLPDTVAVATQRRNTTTLQPLWAAVARLHCAGHAIDWAALLDGCGGRRVPLPTYPFQHESHWTGPAAFFKGPAGPGPRNSSEDDDHRATTENAMTEQSVLDRVLELTAGHLGYEPSQVGADRTFVGLGADSLQLVGMLRQLEGEFGIEIAMREMLEEAGTPRLTATLINARRATGATGATAPAPATSAVGAAPGAATPVGAVSPSVVSAAAAQAGSVSVPPAPDAAASAAPASAGAAPGAAASAVSMLAGSPSAASAPAGSVSAPPAPGAAASAVPALGDLPAPALPNPDEATPVAGAPAAPAPAPAPPTAGDGSLGASPVAMPSAADDSSSAYATRAEVEELSRQIRQLAATQAEMLTQLSEAVALLTEDPRAAAR